MATRSALIQALRLQNDMTGYQADSCIQTMIDWMTETLVSGDEVELRGLGNFKVKKAAPRRAVLNGQAQELPVHNHVIFRPALSLKKAVR